MFGRTVRPVWAGTVSRSGACSTWDEWTWAGQGSQGWGGASPGPTVHGQEDWLSCSAKTGLPPWVMLPSIKLQSKTPPPPAGPVSELLLLCLCLLCPPCSRQRRWRETLPPSSSPWPWPMGLTCQYFPHLADGRTLRWTFCKFSVTPAGWSYRCPQRWRTWCHILVLVASLSMSHSTPHLLVFSGTTTQINDLVALRLASGSASDRARLRPSWLAKSTWLASSSPTMSGGTSEAYLRCG